ncbi:MAG: tetratricopeptide repeat protein [Pirellulaceae bacterium]
MRNSWKQLCLLGALALLGSGCASLKTPWNSDSDVFGNRLAAKPSASDEGGFASTLSKTTKGITGQFKSMGSAVSSAYSKTKSAVSNTFTAKDPDNMDPLSLANMPSKESLGPEIWVTQGQLYESQNNFTKALDNYTKALELDPQSEPALLSTARLYARQEQHGTAADFFSKAIAVNPDSATFNELGLSLKAQGRLAEAQASVRKAIELDASNPRYRNNLAGMLVSAGRADEAVQELQQVFPPAVANYNVAYLQYQNKNTAAAHQHLQSALDIDPNLKIARDLMAQIGNNNAVQSAMAAYQMGTDAMNSMGTSSTPQLKANPAVYQMPKQPLNSTGQQLPGLPEVQGVQQFQSPAARQPSTPAAGSQGPAVQSISYPKTMAPLSRTAPIAVGGGNSTGVQVLSPQTEKTPMLSLPQLPTVQ